MGDIAEMYLRIEITFKGRPYQRFLRRALNQERAPGEYEFDRVVFGVNPSPFLACVQPPAPLRENRRRGVTVANCVRRPSDFSRMCGKWFHWLLLVDLVDLLVENYTHVAIQIQELQRKPKN